MLSKRNSSSRATWFASARAFASCCRAGASAAAFPKQVISNTRRKLELTIVSISRYTTTVHTAVMMTMVENTQILDRLAAFFFMR